MRQQVGIIEQQTEAQKIIIESQAIAQKRAQEGYTYQQERGFDVAGKVAENEAVGQFTNMGIGLGTMAGVGGAVGGVVAVSYTHLDVYKRQSIICTVRPYLSMARLIISVCYIAAISIQIAAYPSSAFSISSILMRSLVE